MRIHTFHLEVLTKDCVGDVSVYAPMKHALDEVMKGSVYFESYNLLHLGSKVTKLWSTEEQQEKEGGR